MLTIPANWVTIMSVYIRATGFVRGEKADDRSLVIDERDYNTGITVQLFDCFNIFRVRKFNPVSAIGLYDV